MSKTAQTTAPISPLPAPATGAVHAGTSPVAGATSPKKTDSDASAELEGDRDRALSPLVDPAQSVKSDRPTPRRPVKAGRATLLVSALMVVGLPTLTAATYYAFFASDQYAAGGHFVVRHRGHAPAAGAGLSAMLGLGGALGVALPDTMVVNDYMASLQMIKDLEQLVDLRDVFGTETADWWARLRPPYGHDRPSDENLRDYWQKMSTVRFDHTTGLSMFEVRAFSAAEAEAVAKHVFNLSEKLVNRLSERAQEDALALARQEVEKHRERAIESLDKLLAFQERARQVDPEGFATARVEIQAGIEEELTKLQAQLDVLRTKLPEDAPGIIQIKDRLNVVEKQLATERTRSTTAASGESAAKILNEFQKLKLESEFATQAYMSSLSSLESARVEAIRQQLYLETFVRPHLPQIPEYPRALLNTVLVLIVSFLVWAIGGLMITAAREHV